MFQIQQDRARSLIAQRHIDDAMMRHGAHGRDDGALLPAARRSRGDEDAGVLAPIGAVGPLLAGVVPEGLPLGGEVAVAGRDAEEEGVVLRELVGRDFGDRGFGGRVH